MKEPSFGDTSDVMFLSSAWRKVIGVHRFFLPEGAARICGMCELKIKTAHL